MPAPNTVEEHDGSAGGFVSTRGKDREEIEESEASLSSRLAHHAGNKEADWKPMIENQN